MQTPPRIVPPERPLGRLAFLARFVRNPLETIPQAAYEQDAVAFGASGRALWITSPALIKTVLLDEREKYRKLIQIRLLGPLLGRGILTSEGPDWRWQRQATSPMFRTTGLGHFVPAFVQAAEATVARWRSAGASAVHRIDDDMTRTTFAVISTTLLPAADDSFGRTVQLHTDRLQRHAGWDILYASLKMPSWVPRPGARAKGEAIQVLREWVMRVLQARKSGRLPEQDDLMQRLIVARDPESGTAMDDEQLVDNLLTFYLAGHETTAKALTWTLYLLARAPEWQQRLREEVERVTGGAALAAGHLEQLVLAEQVVKEAMRLYPPAPMLGRQAVAEGELGGHRIVPGMNIQIPIYVVHRHAARWDRPDAFDPDRFAAEREKEIPRYQYMPFGAGPRVCIGMSFALMEAKAILAVLVRSARFEALEGHHPLPVARVTLAPKGGMPLRVIV
jgi:cytochrome P450